MVRQGDGETGNRETEDREMWGTKTGKGDRVTGKQKNRSTGIEGNKKMGGRDRGTEGQGDRKMEERETGTGSQEAELGGLEGEKQG